MHVAATPQLWISALRRASDRRSNSRPARARLSNGRGRHKFSRPFAQKKNPAEAGFKFGYENPKNLALATLALSAALLLATLAGLLLLLAGLLLLPALLAALTGLLLLLAGFLLATLLVLLAALLVLLVHKRLLTISPRKQ
jgi:hypothetical protein